MSVRLWRAMASSIAGCAVAERIDADAAEQIEVAIAFSSMRCTPSPPHKENGIALVGRKQQPSLLRREFDRVSSHVSFSSGHHHFGAMGYARTAQVGQGTGSFGGQNPYALDAIQQSFAAGAELGQHAAGDDGAFGHLGNLIDGEPAHHFAVCALTPGTSVRKTSASAWQAMAQAAAISSALML